MDTTATSAQTRVVARTATRLATAVAFVVVVTTSATGWAIMRRHDVPDSEYIVPPDAHPAIVDLLERGLWN